MIAARQVGDKAHAVILTTEGFFSTTCGYFECRAKMQKQQGWQTAFWLQSAHMGDLDNGRGEPDDTARNGTEIDIFEYLAREDDVIHHCLHWNGYKALHKRSPGTAKLPGLKDGFHTFGVEWTPGGYTFFVDGKKTFETRDAVSATDEYILVSGEIGPWGGDITKAKLPDEVVFDYVRVYKKATP